MGVMGQGFGPFDESSRLRGGLSHKGVPCPAEEDTRAWFYGRRHINWKKKKTHM